MGIKVLVISNYRATTTARPEAEIFIGLAKRGYEVEIMTYADSAYVEKFKAAGIKVIDFHPEKKFDKEEVQFIRKTLIEGKHDILHLYNSKSTVNGIQAAKGLDVKVCLYRGYTHNVNWWDPYAYYKYLNPRVDAIVCNSKGVKDALDRQMIISRNKTFTINKGHRTEWYEDIQPIKKSELGLEENAFVISCVANNRRMKGIPFLLKAMNHLRPGLNIHLLLVGNDMDSSSNLSIANNSVYKSNIHFLGFRKDALSITKMSDIIALSSIKAESINKSVLEGMSLGTTPVITDIPGNVELIVDGESGLVVPKANPKALGEAFQKLFNDRERLQEMGKKAKQRIETRLNCDYTIEEYDKLYSSLVPKEKLETETV